MGDQQRWMLKVVGGAWTLRINDEDGEWGQHVRIRKLQEYVLYVGIRRFQDYKLDILVKSRTRKVELSWKRYAARSRC